MKAPTEATLVIRCASGTGCTLAYVIEGTAYVSEWTTRLGIDNGTPVATHARLRQATGLQPYDLQEELLDPTSVVASCRCGNWSMNLGSVAQMHQQGTRGQVVTDAPKMRDWNQVIRA